MPQIDPGIDPNRRQGRLAVMELEIDRRNPDELVMQEERMSEEPVVFPEALAMIAHDEHGRVVQYSAGSEAVEYRSEGRVQARGRLAVRRHHVEREPPVLQGLGVPGEIHGRKVRQVETGGAPARRWVVWFVHLHQID